MNLTEMGKDIRRVGKGEQEVVTIEYNIYARNSPKNIRIYRLLKSDGTYPEVKHYI